MSMMYKHQDGVTRSYKYCNLNFLTFCYFYYTDWRLRLTKPCPAVGTWIFLGVYFKNDRPAMVATIRQLQDPYNSGGDGPTIIRTIY